MTDPKNLDDLEAALHERAQRLAEEYLARGRDSREVILSEERERLRGREERITEEAQAVADRLYRRRVQAAQLRLQSALDRERWSLIQSVIRELPTRLQETISDTDRYDTLLATLISQAAESIGEDQLTAALNSDDLVRLKGQWKDFAGKAAPGMSIKLDSQPVECSGGVRISSQDNRTSVDATFEGRCERFRDDLIHTIAERLFARAGMQAG